MLRRRRRIYQDTFVEVNKVTEVALALVAPDQHSATTIAAAWVPGRVQALACALSGPDLMVEWSAPWNAALLGSERLVHYEVYAPELARQWQVDGEMLSVLQARPREGQEVSVWVRAVVDGAGGGVGPYAGPVTCRER